MKQKQMTCQYCANGCLLTVTYEKQTLISVLGNSCERGKRYAQQQCSMEIWKGNIQTEDGRWVSVQSVEEISKEQQQYCEQKFAEQTIETPIFKGERIYIEQGLNEIVFEVLESVY